MNLLYHTILAKADPSQVQSISRFFKTNAGQYAQGDVFLGIKVPIARSVVKDVWKQLTFTDLEECIQSPYHELRLAGLFALIQMYKHAHKEPARQKQCVDFYLAHMKYVNNWDLVDLTCYDLLGDWLLYNDRTILYALSDKGNTVWEQRIGIVTTMAFLRRGQLDDTYAIADIFLCKPKPLHDLLQKACGWLLREAGKRDLNSLISWLTPRYKTMPRTMLRYAIERFPQPLRQRFLMGKV